VLGLRIGGGASQAHRAGIPAVPLPHGRQVFHERSAGLQNRTQYPGDVIALVLFWRLRYKPSLRDLAEMFLVRGTVFSHEAVRKWEAKLTRALAEGLRGRRCGRISRSW
jgi:transposase-like protein